MWPMSVIRFFGVEVDLVEIDSDEFVGAFVVEVVFDVWEVTEDGSINSIWVLDNGVDESAGEADRDLLDRSLPMEESELTGVDGCLAFQN